MNKQLIVQTMEAAGYTQVSFMERQVFQRAGAGGIGEALVTDVFLAPARMLEDSQWPAVAAAKKIGLKFETAQETHDRLILRACSMDEQPATKEPAKKTK